MDVTVPAGMVGTGLVTLEAGEVCTVRFTDNIGAVEIISDGAADVWYTLDGSAPTVGGRNCWRLPAGGMVTDTRAVTDEFTGSKRAQLVSQGTPTITAQRA